MTTIYLYRKTPMIYAVVNTKGGVGKTLLIDGDQQVSAASWAAWQRDNANFEPSPTTKLFLPRANNLQNVVIDAGS